MFVSREVSALNSIFFKMSKHECIGRFRDGNRSGRPAGWVTDRVEILRPAGKRSNYLLLQLKCT